VAEQTTYSSFSVDLVFEWDWLLWSGRSNLAAYENSKHDSEENSSYEQRP
jgi:hypothetical protein